jgi:hypothetical protein
MSTGDFTVFKASKWRFLAYFLAAGWTGIAIAHFLFISNEDIGGFIAAVVGCTIGVVLLALVVTRRFDIILTADELQGPELGFLRIRRISVPLRSADLPRSKKGSFWITSFIRTIEGHKMIVSSFHFSRKQMDRIFKELKRRVGNKRT